VRSRHPTNSARAEFLLFEQVQLELANLLGAQLFWRFAEEFRKLLDGMDVATSRFPKSS